MGIYFKKENRQIFILWQNRRQYFWGPGNHRMIPTIRPKDTVKVLTTPFLRHQMSLWTRQKGTPTMYLLGMCVCVCVCVCMCVLWLFSFNVFYTFNSYCNWLVLIITIDWYTNVKYFIMFTCNLLHSSWLLIYNFNAIYEEKKKIVCVCVCVKT